MFDIKQTDKEYVLGTYLRQNLAIKSGNGSKLYDDNGKEYIDFGSGIAVNTFGANDEIWKNAVIEQIGKIQHTSNYYYTEPCAVLAKKLCSRTGMKKVFFSNSGAEANECAIKTARKYGTDKDPLKNVVITMKQSFHGRTITTLSATGQDVFHNHFTPFTEGFVYAEPNDKNDIENLVNKYNCAAIMLEIIQGEAGVNNLSKEYLEFVQDICKKNDMLFIVDEVQTGNGRTGELFAYMKYGLKPDIVTTAKGLAGGLPIGATMFSEKTENVLGYGSHGSTFGGNPVSCAAAITIVDRLDEKFLNSVNEKGDYIKEKLLKFSGVEYISGEGLMIGIKTKKEASKILQKCMENGLLVLTAKDKVRLLPPLSISYEEIDTGLEILKGVIEE